MKLVARYLLIAFYVFAGINHFWHSSFYYPIIPPFLQQWGYELNTIAGIAEISLGLLMAFEATRKIAAIGIVAMLIAFIPTHIYFIQIGSCVPNGLCVPAWIGWVRLLIIHPILLTWAWWCR
ncbi:MAG: hypothetical protein H7101_07410 [Deinococcales bacterium]|nr:hypothetical protein [Chitinophagaceae bacterium]